MVRRLIFAAACLAAVLLLSTSCRTRRPLITPNNTTPADSAAISERLQRQAVDTLLYHLRRQQLPYEWFVAKAKAHIESPEQSLGFTIQIRQQRDSLTWMTFKKASVEGARLRLMPKSIEIIDRQNNEYTQTDFAFLSSKFNLPLDFVATQQMLTASPFWLDSLQWKAATEDSLHRLDGRRASLELNYYLQPATYQLQRLSARMGVHSVNIYFADYRPINGSTHSIAHEIDIRVESPDAGGSQRLLIQYNDISLLPPDNVRFEVPDHYTRK